eukprot:CAMPEP_0114987270 /NCGR_PEP_ID=MMETSP0216-20121206/8909_1 /TAXON_ID=223996 /ORGANISM="Protocruzia adherens, Strain Boccale" /LENGTH=185 /DNA_ID=CAMNT_0002349839 /DNA_START=318 /DNA_END=875 /DNA_ORIENTATION=+
MSLQRCPGALIIATRPSSARTTNAMVTVSINRRARSLTATLNCVHNTPWLVKFKKRFQPLPVRCQPMFYTSLTHNRPADRYTQDNEEPVNPEFFQEAIKQHQAQMMYFEAKSNVSRDHSEDYSNSFSSSMDEYRTAYDYEYRSCGNSSDLVSSRFDSSEEEYSREDFVFETDNWKYGDDSLNTSD